MSSIISTMLILLLMMTMISTILLWATPVLEDYETSNQYNSMRGVLESVDERVELLTGMGVNSSIRMNTLIPDGSLAVSEEPEFWTVSFNYADHDSGADFRYLELEKNQQGDAGMFRISSTYKGSVDILLEWPGTGDSEEHRNLTIGDTLNLSTVHPVTSPFKISIVDGDGLISACHVFPLTSLRGTFNSPRGPYVIRAINGAVLTDFPDRQDPKWIRRPGTLTSVLPDSSGHSPEGDGARENVLVLDFLRFNAVGLSRAWQGEYGLDLSYRELAQFDEGGVRNIRLRVYGKYQESIYRAIAPKGYAMGVTQEGFTDFIPDVGSDGGRENLLFQMNEKDDGPGGGEISLIINDHRFDVNMYKK